MWPSGQSTRPPCAVGRDVLGGRGSRLSMGASAYRRINNNILINNNSHAHDKEGVNPGQVRGLNSVLYKL